MSDFCEYCGGNDDPLNGTKPGDWNYHPKAHTMDCGRPFKVMHMRGKEYPEQQVESVPWEFVVRHEASAQKNHSQSLERLNERGGLSPLELFAVVNGLGFREANWQMTEAGAIAWLTKKPWECEHAPINEGPLYPLRYGTKRTDVCKCGAWRTKDHYGKSLSEWRFDDIEIACERDDEA